MKIYLFAATLLTVPNIPAQQADIKLPPPFQTPSVNNGPRVIAKPEGAGLKLPSGFTVVEYMSGFKRPRFMLNGHNGEILLSDTVQNGTVFALTGKDRKELITGLDRPYGLAFYKDYLYVAEATSLKRYKYNAKALTADHAEELVNYKDFTKGHTTRTILFDAKNEKMYLSIGSESNVSPGEDPRRAAINRYNPDGTGHEIYAAGLRNVIGLRWYPGTNDLWAATQERDALGDDLVSDYFTKVKQGGFYGWPFAYTGPNEDPRNKGQQPELVKKTIVPDVILGAHVAVLDTIFYTGKQFPAKYQGGAFLAFHGSWNRSLRVGQSIAFIPFKNGNPNGPVEQFLSGWMLAPDKREVWGRPVGLLQMADGSLLITEDGGNKIWHVTYKK